jgi:hypothetical protein
VKAAFTIFAVALLCLSSCHDKPAADANGTYSTKVNSNLGETLKQLDSMSAEEATHGPKAVAPDNLLKASYAGRAPTTLPAMPIELNGQLMIRSTRSPGGSEFLPPVVYKPGDVKTLTLGTANDGAAVTYEVGVFEDDELPVHVHVVLVGRRTADVRFVGRIRNGQSGAFHSATRTGEQIHFIVSVDARPDAGQPLPSSVMKLPPVTPETPGLIQQPGRRGKQ